MRLRRGMVRESCDFCHRRKIKCDRLSRNDTGHTACSQCSLRGVPCRMDDSDDIRLRGRCRQAQTRTPSSPAALSTPATSSEQLQTPTTSVRRTLRQSGGVPGRQSPSASRLGTSIATAGASPVSTASMASVDEATNSSTSSFGRPPQHIVPSMSTSSMSTSSLATPASINLEVGDQGNAVHSLLAPSQSPQSSQTQPLSQPQLHPQSSLSYNVNSSAGNINTFHSIASINTPPSSSVAEDLMFLDDPFHLNADSIFFLDQIFTGYPDGPAYGPLPTWPSSTGNTMSSSDLQPLVLNQMHPAQVQALPTASDASLPVHSYTLQATQQPSQEPSQEPSQPPPQEHGGPALADGLSDGGYDPPPWTRCGLDEATFLRALRAYFAYATLYLPILLEDAFWQDYQAGRCSLSIIYAVACRGLPFTAPPLSATRDDRRRIWRQQQRVAEQFREAFFAAQLSANRSGGRARLDDLEALALMVFFKYSGDEGGGGGGDGGGGGKNKEATLSQLHAHLAGLYLTRDSLVLMTMQSGIDVPDVGSQPLSTACTSSDPTAPAARLHDRRTILFWHVYGLDSFDCLDKKTLSRIPDCNHHLLLPTATSTSTSAPKRLPALPRHHEEARGYLDAVLDLAVIARKALVSLSNATARRSGVRADQLESVYALLEQWQRTTCPAHLRRQRDADGRLSLAAGVSSTNSASSTNNTSSADGGQVQLHRAVVWILEINCYLQIADCVDQYGILAPATTGLDDEVARLRVEAETLRQVRDAVHIARAILAYDASPRRGTTFSLPDLGTSIVRDCCVGVARWACFRGQQKGAVGGITTTTATSSDKTKRTRHTMATYLEAATVLRDAAATAVSHADTQPAIDRLDEQIASLVAAMDDVAGK
ncbi:hypothetical protein SPBR_06622 [Sporothrix brasiliensis 5110]|uniref:Zn(2)-C6 fungal-type domain-containing protein n=1 Tax=Sporothrix brasiliensis 5110 TaxID=1398154 RepID=A0A0C2IUU9_9PEZI|nr:uncharacterized protein SPBR_06622 [Sporothrix brasiliensis 5110]KIH88762.1 hypothetical protein SPBR_06622 [Sporothrix brasiliensis 5110]